MCERIDDYPRQTDTRKFHPRHTYSLCARVPICYIYLYNIILLLNIVIISIIIVSPYLRVLYIIIIIYNSGARLASDGWGTYIRRKTCEEQ